MTVNFNLNQRFGTLANLSRVVSTAPFPNGETHTSVALDYARQYVFSPANGSRPTPVRQVLVVITDGQANAGFVTS